jgi:hypothetical protein
MLVIPDDEVLEGGTDVAVKVMLAEILLPVTVREPGDGDREYPETDPTVYEYVPFGTVNVIVLDADVSIVPLRVSDQVVPDGRPVSLKAIVYLLIVVLTGVNATA